MLSFWRILLFFWAALISFGRLCLSASSFHPINVYLTLICLWCFELLKALAGVFEDRIILFWGIRILLYCLTQAFEFLCFLRILLSIFLTIVFWLSLRVLFSFQLLKAHYFYAPPQASCILLPFPPIYFWNSFSLSLLTLFFAGTLMPYSNILSSNHQL